MLDRKNKMPANWKKIPVFCLIDHSISETSDRHIVRKEIIVNMDNFQSVVPQHYGLGYGKGKIVHEYPRTIEYEHEIPSEDYVCLHFSENTSYYMTTVDFFRVFNLDSPSILGIDRA